MTGFKSKTFALAFSHAFVWHVWLMRLLPQPLTDKNQINAHWHVTSISPSPISARPVHPLPESCSQLCRRHELGAGHQSITELTHIDKHIHTRVHTPDRKLRVSKSQDLHVFWTPRGKRGKQEEKPADRRQSTGEMQSSTICPSRRGCRV